MGRDFTDEQLNLYNMAKKIISFEETESFKTEINQWIERTGFIDINHRAYYEFQVLMSNAIKCAYEKGLTTKK